MSRPFELENRMPLRTITMLLAALGGIMMAALPPTIGAQAKTSQMSNEDVKGLFATTCGWCHANGGRTAGKGPQLAGTKRSDSFITNRIKNGKEGAMPAFQGTLNDTQIKGIIHYIRSLKTE
jgi:mono/diheme cytochrome c family protein